jgi:hypothetical protein
MNEMAMFRDLPIANKMSAAARQQHKPGFEGRCPVRSRPWIHRPKPADADRKVVCMKGLGVP